jgi:peptidoglycan hydrolase CwlO-like protein
VNGVERCRTTSPRPARRVGWGTRNAWTLVGLALVSAAGAALAVTPVAASGDQVSSLKSQAAQIARDLVLEQLQIGTDQQQYEVDGQKVAEDQARISSTESAVAADARRISRDRDRLRKEALAAYVNLDPQAAGSQVLFVGSQSDALARTEYEVVASGDTNLTIAQLHSDENGLRVQQAALQQQQAQDQATTNQQAAQAGAARQTQSELSSKQAQITGQLAVAVAQQQAAQAAAAAKAVQAAQAAAAAAASRSSASPSTSSTNGNSTSTTQAAGVTTAQGSVSSTATADPALPPFLQCVLRVESGGNYQAVSPGGTYMGGFQFSQSTWNEAAQLAGMPQLVNVPPNTASPADQDDLAIALYNADGQQPWDDSCRNG